MNILYIISVYNIYGGTPKKTLDLIKHSQNNCFMYLYEDGFNEFKYLFEDAGAIITEGYFGRNVFKHVMKLLKLIDKHQIQLIQTQFTMGEILGTVVKILRPKVKLIVTFESSLTPSFLKKQILRFLYNKVDVFVFISRYVKQYKEDQFHLLANKYSEVIYNGAELRKNTKEPYPTIKSIGLLDVASLIELKNMGTLISAIDIIIHKKKYINLFLYIVGEGPQRANLERIIRTHSLENNIMLIGHQSNIGALLYDCDIFVHPSYAEGFGLAVAEAMLAGKPIIVANAGALPELIENERTGLVVDPFNAQAWSDAIIKLIENKELSKELGINAKKKAAAEFSIKKYVNNYIQLYNELINE